ncbi:MAG: hypothetical protein AEth_00824 [Candidatus Argoarchaeum ethanivorans]|uniref:Uncharacterized protein n=1 Tax=Candidatus Argoarchaeum ethanivorans TaxID=2608793 RepID=A0A8B3S2R8_9EURY|nr:MAG: hypothetical protein AEth_00824 [Candidatus Argoarchaeum ethanivorans]
MMERFTEIGGASAASYNMVCAVRACALTQIAPIGRNVVYARNVI